MKFVFANALNPEIAVLHFETAALSQTMGDSEEQIPGLSETVEITPTPDD